MSLKTKISFIISLLFSVIFAISSIVIYLSFADFRRDEFEFRLKEKAISSIKLIIEAEQADPQLLKIIDQNNIDELFQEKTLVFDSTFTLIYSSLSDTKIEWTLNDLEFLKRRKSFFRRTGEQETYGIFYDTNKKDYYAMASATDSYGRRKLEYLLYILIGTYFGFTIIIWFLTSFLIKRLLLPLDIFHDKLKGINEHNLDTKIPVKQQKDEIDLLADEFNQMLQRIDVSYQKQKEFTAHASHELRTPVARLISQIENRISDRATESQSKEFLKNLLKDTNQISELISSLLVLSKIENKGQVGYDVCRVDELIYETSAKLSLEYPDFKLLLNIQENELSEKYLEIRGTKSLLEIAFSNLLKNAYLYSDNKQVTVDIKSNDQNLAVSFSNTGATITEEEYSKLFQPFMRGKNSKNKPGLGLGLRIVHRILLQHNAVLEYTIPAPNINKFTILFPL